ncbi:MAG: hypothetical protein IKQ80_07230 [Clostridia bacterium]|nr:hypothetical protein [Clostridia bacterium]MBR6890616.1 hypothetical protein [Clostridia bacterium]
MDNDHLQFDLGIIGCIRNLKGVECFTNLRYLDVSNQDLRTLDVSKNTRLVGLYCDYNESLKTLKLGKQKNLDHLSTFFCKKLKKIDIGGCPKLLALLNQYDNVGGFGQTFPTSFRQATFLKRCPAMGSAFLIQPVS